MSQKLKKLSSLKRTCCLLISLPFCLSVHATQVIEGATLSHVEVNISAKEQNRLAVQGRQISTVVPSSKGAITYQKDEAQGALYFALSGNSPEGATVTLFVGDDKGQTYKIILVPKNIPGEEVILKPPAEREGSSHSSTGGAGKAALYQRTAKEMTLWMADESLSNRMEKVLVNKEMPLWKEGRLIYVSRMLQANLVGETYRLTNTSASPMVLVEQELYRRGVRTVAIEFHTLAPGDSTDIFIVRDRKTNE